MAEAESAVPAEPAAEAAGKLHVPMPLDVGRTPGEVTGMADARLAGQLVTQLADSLWLPTELDEAERVAQVAAAAAALRDLAPRDALEGMLGTQMVAAHAAAMECLRRAAAPVADRLARDDALRQAARLLGLYAKQLETLNRHRGRGGQQRVTVEHVRVESGGQAIVGHVSGGERAR